MTARADVSVAETTASAVVSHERSEEQIAVIQDKASGSVWKRVRIGPGTALVIGAFVVMVLARLLFGGRWILSLGAKDPWWVHSNLNTWQIWVEQNQNSNGFFLYFVNHIQIALQDTGTFTTHLFSHTDVGRGLPFVGWIGTIVLMTWIAYAIGNLKVAALTAAVFLLFLLQNLWSQSMDTFSQVIAAVFYSFLIGIPLGIWAGTSERVSKIVTPVLDFMQIMPALAYLSPLVLIFSIGPASAIAATLIFAVPPVIRISAHGIRQIPATTRESVDSLGVTRWQRLRTVLLPLAKRTIVIGMNQTIMAALAMVAIASFIGAPGLGVVVSNALQSGDVGAGFNGGLAIVLMAIMFDRVSTASSVRAERAARANTDRRRLRLISTGAGLAVVVLAIYLSRTQLWAAQAPQNWPDWGSKIASAVNGASNWIKDNLQPVTLAIKNGITYGLINPLESLLVSTPFFIVGLFFTVVAFVAGGWRVAVVVALLLAALVGFGLWSSSMATLASTLVGALVCMIISVVVGVWMGRSKRVDQIIRPVLDGLQTMPSFVFLIPFLGLFDVGRFTAIVAAVSYAAPAAIKIIADGISQVPTNTIEAAQSAGSTTWQMITKVQLPMARKSIALAANQALIYTLSMVVIGAAVGAGALGYDVLVGLNDSDSFGRGLSAGLSLVILGVVLDRITQAAAERSTRRARKTAVSVRSTPAVEAPAAAPVRPLAQPATH